MPTGRTLFAVDNPNNQVVVVDASANPIAVACTIAVGHSPTNLAVSPDSALLFVENDTDASLTVVTLADPSLPGNVTTITSTTLGITAPMTANLAVSPDGTFLYLVSIGTGDTQAQLSVISLPTLTVAPKTAIVTSPAVPVPSLGPLGVAFTPLTTSSPTLSGKAVITTESASYAIDVATQAIIALADSSQSNGPVIAGTVAADPGGTVAYAIDASSNAAGDATVYRIDLSTNSTASLVPPVTPICTVAGNNSITAPNTPTAQRAYYTCPGNTFIQAIDLGTNSSNAVGNLTVGSGSAAPQGISIPFDGVTAYVGLDDGTLAAVDIASSIASPAVTVGTALRGVGHRPITITGLSPLNPSVPTGTTKPFTSVLGFAKGTTLIWTVNNMAPNAMGVSGNATTVGTIDSTGLYTAPPTIPASTVTIGVTSPEAPPISKFYPLTTTVTITPSQLVFTNMAVTVTAGVCSTAITLQSRDSSNNPANPSTTEMLALASNSTGTTTFYSDSTCTTTITSASIPTTANFATFFYKDTKAASPTITVTGSGSFAATITQSETVTPGVASNLVFTTQPGGGTGGVAWTTQPVVTLEDASGNTVTGTAQNVTVAIQNNAGPGGVLSGTTTVAVNTSTGLATFSGLSIDKAGTGYTLTATGSTVNTTAGAVVSSAFNIAVGPATQLVFTTQPVSGALGGNQKPLAPVAVSVEDKGGNVVTTDTSTVLMTISSGGSFSAGSTTTVPASAGGIPGVATFSNLFATIAGTFTLSATDGTLTGATSNPFTLISTITVNITSTFSTVKIEDFPAGTDTFTAVPNATTPSGDPNVPSLNVTWIMFTCSGSPVNTNNPTPCGQVAPNGAYTPPTKVPLSPANTFTVQATAVADPSKTATSSPITIKSSIMFTMPASISNVLIGGPVDFTPKATGGNVNLGAGANQSDLSLGVTLVITGPCFAPPNYSGFSSTNPCTGSFSPNGSQNNGNPPTTYSYTAPPVVPLSTAPPADLATANKAKITVTAMSVADPNQPSASTTFMISSNISFTIGTACDPTTLQNTTGVTLPSIAVGTPGSGYNTATYVEANPQGFTSVTGLNWQATAGQIQATGQPGQACPTGQSSQSAAYIGPAAVPNPTQVTITAFAIADFTAKATSPIIVDSSKLIYANQTPLNNPVLNVPAGSNSGFLDLDLVGTISGPSSFACSNFFPDNTNQNPLTNSTCTFVATPAGANAPPLCQLTGNNCVRLTLTVTRASSYLRPPGTPMKPLPGAPQTMLVIAILMLWILLFAKRRWARFSWVSASRWNGAIVLVLLCAVVLTWAAACNQFSQPSTQIPPPIAPTPTGNGAVTVTATPPANPSHGQDSLLVRVQVN